MQKIYFERGVFISWYCSVGDCTFCYMSTQKEKIKEPLRARRTRESVLAEVLLCRILNWKIEFVSAGYGSYLIPDLVETIRDIKEVYGEKLWLNIGALKEPVLKQLLPYVKGVSGSIETLALDIRDRICPSKPIKWFEDMFSLCDKYELKKAITIILGLGETKEDYRELKDFLKKHKIDQVTLYRLKPVKDTEFEGTKVIDTEYYTYWIKALRNDFPKIKIIVGPGIQFMEEIPELIKAGADSFTKYPAIKKFNKKPARLLNQAMEKHDLSLASNLTDLPKVDVDKETNSLSLDKDLKEKVKQKLTDYLSSMSQA